MVVGGVSRVCSLLLLTVCSRIVDGDRIVVDQEVEIDGTTSTTSTASWFHHQEDNDSPLLSVEDVGDENPTSSFDVGDDLGVTQALLGDHYIDAQIQQVLQQARHYVHHVIDQDETYRTIRSACRNQNALCSYWSILGECETNPPYMNITCAPVCQSCEYLLLEKRCPIDPNAVDTFGPGDIDKVARRITTQPEFVRYEHTVLSGPSNLHDSFHHQQQHTTTTAASAPDPSIGPWIITMEHVVSPEEAKILIQLGEYQGFERSKEVGELQGDGTVASQDIQGRTSSNAWCVQDCYHHPVTKALMERIQAMVGIENDSNSDFLQILRYEPGQFYHTHHDYKEYHRRRPMGVRVWTILIYLSHVEEGGGTNFPELQLTVTPKLGRAVIWPSVLNDDPNSIDPRTSHQSLPVVQGTKYAINAWIHQRDMKAANAKACQ